MRLPRPTAFGIKAIVLDLVLVGAFFAAPYANLYFLLLVFLTVLGITGLFWTHRNLAGVEGQVLEPEPMPARSGGPLEVRVQAGKRPRLGVRMEIDLEGAEGVVVSGGVVRGEERLSGRLPPLPRGLYQVRRARLASSWPFGFFRATRPAPAPERIVVYPAPTELTETRGGAGPGAELFGLSGLGDGLLQPSSLREYRSGDELRMIHWKASARRDTLVVKEWEGSAASGHEVVLDRRAGEESFEESLSLLSAVALAAREQKEILTLHTQGMSATFGGRHRPWRELLAFLAGTKRLDAGAPPPPPVSPSVPRLPLRRGGAG